MLAGLLLLGVPALAQTPEPRTPPAELRAQPDKDDDTIVLTLPDEGRALWQRAGQLLARRGYPIRYASPELLTLTTEAIVPREANTMGLVLAVQGHELRLQAYTPNGSTTFPTVWFLMSNQSKGSGRDGHKWQELEEVARLLGGTRQYTRSINY
ncbi:hypothetical protein CDA63_09605 [Hymenobacter amundsenii]|uniref:Uncharacterized protein n=1 Tax=Hymenobacter amundsenii TaxID=2006685 RepID=A0A2D0AFU3_9BACT|nr:hypothetical protein CDA63_09605 [Hymenobacter amundsenii]